MLSAQTGDVHLIYEPTAVEKNMNKFDVKEKKNRNFLKTRKINCERKHDLEGKGSSSKTA